MAEGRAGYCSFESKSVGEDLYFYYEPVAASNWSVALSVPESLAFAGAKQMNTLLAGFNVLEMLLLAAYFLWLMHVTKQELAEKQRLAERGYHVSIGLCRQERPIDMDTLVKQAEAHMYTEKDCYYQKTGALRRS